MPSYPNIDKSGFTAKTYVGYAAGTIWRIRKRRYGFVAHMAKPALNEQFTKQTLAQVSWELERRANLIQAAKGLA